MKHLYIIVISLCLFLILWSCKESEEGFEPSLTINNDELAFTGYRSSLSVKVDATRRWSAVTSDYWINVTPDHYPGAEEHFVANVSITVADNTTGQIREGHVTFFLQDEEIVTLTVKQSIQSEEDKPEEEFPITWANLNWKSADTIGKDGVFDAGSCVFADGITNAMKSDTGENITCEIGYSDENVSPETGDWTWISCPFSADWGDNFYYQGRLEGLSPGIYYFTFRFRNGSGAYKYAGTSGLWNGIDNVNGTLEVTE